MEDAINSKASCRFRIRKIHKFSIRKMGNLELRHPWGFAEEILEQAWISDDGCIEWRPVGVVHEEKEIREH